MRIKDGYVMRGVAGTFVIVPTGQAAVDFNGLMTLNEVGASIWQQLGTECSVEDLLAALLGEYEVDEATAKSDLAEFLDALRAADLLA
ncbi:MAG: PqqD family protein [Bacillota bacterium]